MTHPPRPSSIGPLLLLGLGILVYIWSAFGPSDRITWIAETVPALIGAAILVATRNRFPLTMVSYTLIWLFCIILMVGGRYTYAEVPVGNWFRDTFDLSRNHFDRLGHIFQGIVPAMVGREILLRTSPLRPGRWLFFLCITVAVFVSAVYEIIEWRYAIRFGAEQAEDFLGSQGDPWDAQTDMLMATLGAILAQLFLSGLQDRQISRLNLQPPARPPVQPQGQVN